MGDSGGVWPGAALLLTTPYPSDPQRNAVNLPGEQAGHPGITQSDEASESLREVDSQVRKAEKEAVFNEA